VTYIRSPIYYRSLIVAISVAAVLAYAIAGVVAEISAIIAAVRFHPHCRCVRLEHRLFTCLSVCLLTQWVLSSRDFVYNVIKQVDQNEIERSPIVLHPSLLSIIFVTVSERHMYHEQGLFA